MGGGFTNPTTTNTSNAPAGNPPQTAGFSIAAPKDMNAAAAPEPATTLPASVPSPAPSAGAQWSGAMPPGMGGMGFMPPWLSRMMYGGGMGGSGYAQNFQFQRPSKPTPLPTPAPVSEPPKPVNPNVNNWGVPKPPNFDQLEATYGSWDLDMIGRNLFNQGSGYSSIPGMTEYFAYKSTPYQYTKARDEGALAFSRANPNTQGNGG